MSIFGLLELSRQRMHSSFFESNYQVCPYCQGKGMVRTIESGAVYVLRGIEEEGIKGRSSRLNVYVPSDVAIYLLNQKRQCLMDLEQKYKMSVIISADNSVQCISDYRVERTKVVKVEEEKLPEPEVIEEAVVQDEMPVIETNEKEEDVENVETSNSSHESRYRNNRRRRDNRRRGRNNRRERNYNNNDAANNQPKEKSEAIILYNSHEDIKFDEVKPANTEPTKEKSTWWKKLIKG